MSGIKRESLFIAMLVDGLNDGITEAEIKTLLVKTGLAEVRDGEIVVIEQPATGRRDS